MKLVVRDREQATVFVDAYTLFGLKYATVANVYNPQTGALVCTGRIATANHQYTRFALVHLPPAKSWTNNADSNP